MNLYPITRLIHYFLMSQQQYRIDPYIQKINPNYNNKRIRKKPPKLCPDCKDANDCVELISNRVNRIEEIVDKFKNLPKKKIDKISKFNAKCMLNNVPCELEYDLSNFTLENLQKLVMITTTQFSNLNEYQFSKSSNSSE